MEGIHEDKLEDSLTASSDLKEKKNKHFVPLLSHSPAVMEVSAQLVLHFRDLWVQITLVI